MFPILTDLERRLPIYLNNLGGWIHQDLMERPHGFAEYQWLQVTSGRGFLRVQGREMTIGPGQGMLLLPNEPHAYGPLEAPWGIKWVTFTGNRTAEMLQDLDLHCSEVFYLGNPDVSLKHLQEMYSLLQSPHPTTGLETSAVIYRLLLDIYRYGSRTELRSRKHQMDVLSPVLDYMELHYDRTIALAELAELLKVSPQHVCVLFQQALGVRPIEYLTRIRIRKAKELLLLHPDAEVKAVSTQVGYEHPSYFIKLFKQQEGLTPVMFRRIHLSRL
ncbi:AraC family transcriptional regulator [Paenibacillus abyssi]|uniref:Transcriptional regulator n=1 Tax=Paenibacillus abyssi TaxID=1340531 RepID=A0A917LHV3_9BACL|nr:AraC family transcriptional regulator [Paenibacillus abyssi]GGG25155.1 transcriptional regulator [Paenibacillus abyssi]